jgi:hypothetical protein
MASMSNTPGIKGKPGKCPSKIVDTVARAPEFVSSDWQVLELDNAIDQLESIRGAY